MIISFIFYLFHQMPAEELHVWQSELDAKGEAVRETGFHPNKEKGL